MNATVENNLRSRGVSEQDTNRFINYELLPFLFEMRRAVNYKSVVSIPPFPTAATGTPTTVWSSADIAEGTAVRIDADVMGVTASLSAKACVTISGLFFNDGTTQQEGATATILSNNGPGFVIGFLVVDNHVELQVDDTGLSVTWRAVMTSQEAP